MRNVSAEMTERWLREDKTGAYRPMVRATIQKTHLIRHFYDTWKQPGGTFEDDKHRVAPFTSLLMGQENDVIELRNIKSLNWARSTNQDVAEATLTILNTEVVPIGHQDESSDLDDFDRPGAYTFTRGEPGHEESPWGFVEDTSWNGLIVPDRMVKTYEGYGCNPLVVPGRDPNLVQSGTWLIDEVTLSETTGEIVIKMRDLGRLLLDQMVFPPCVPHEEYPLRFSKIRKEKVLQRGPVGGSWVDLRTTHGAASSSNDVYAADPEALTWTNKPLPEYVKADGSVNGHHAVDVLHNSDQKHWRSTGQDRYMAKVWWQIDFNSPKDLAGIRIKTKGGPYKVYVSVADDDGWFGKREIPYETWGDASDTERPSSVDVGAAIDLIKQDIADADKEFDLVFGRKVENITSLRITFTRLIDSRIGEYPFIAGLRSVSIYTGAYDSLGYSDDVEVFKAVGNYTDYTDIVKWITSWGGFHWPAPDSYQDFVKLGPGDKQTLEYPSPDPALPRGRVFGDFMRTGTAGVTDLGAELFDKKPLMDVIAYVREVVGFSFWIDEQGAIVWRMPNLWKLGNYVSPATLGEEHPRRTSEIVELTTEDTVTDYSTTLNSKNQRERIFVANSNGKHGVVIKGHRPYRAGLRRVAGWTDQNFKTQRECVVMADMIAARQMFDYRRGAIKIPAYPAIQIDDQIRVYAPVTNETYYHYVEGISSNINLETGEWTYDLTTHWLGENPEDAWVVKVEKLERPTRVYLATLGAVKPEHHASVDPPLSDGARWIATDPLPSPQPARLLGAFHDEGDLGFYDIYGRFPDIAPSFYRRTDVDVIVARERRRIQKGISPFITITTAGSDLLKQIADGVISGMAWLDSYIDKLNDVCAHNEDVTVYATLDRRWEQSVREKRLRGSSATTTTYAKAIDQFVDRVHLRGAANLRAGYAYGSAQGLSFVYQDSDTIAEIFAKLTSPLDFVSFETWSNRFANETFDIAVSNDLRRLRDAVGESEAGLYGADYERLGSPPVILGAFGMNVENHTPSVLAAFYTGLRANLEQHDLLAAVFHDSLTDGPHRIDDGHHRAAVAAFTASLNGA